VPFQPTDDAALVIAAQAGDRRALEGLLTRQLPLVYAIVGRSLAGDRTDVDDVVQDIMVRAVAGLPGLREPERFRGWLVTIAVHQLRDHARRRSRGQGALRAQQVPLDFALDLPDPAPDFVEATNDRLRLSAQRREVQQASQWLTPADRSLLALWWQEVAGSMTRAEVAAALRLSLPHTAVRVQRMKAQLDLARMLVRAWHASPRCVELSVAATGWDRRFEPRWLKRLARHVRGCARCQLAGQEFVPAEDLMPAIGPIVPPAELLGAIPSIVGGSAALTHGVGLLSTQAPLAVVRVARRTMEYLNVKVAAVLGAGVASIAAVVSLAVYYPPPEPPLDALVPAPPTVPAEAATRVAPATPPTAAPGAGAAVPAPGPGGVTTADFYVSPLGDDGDAGTADSPFASLNRAAAVVQPGQVIAVRGGIYQPSEPIVFATSGTADDRITVSNYVGEQPVIDAGRIPADQWTVTQTASYWTVQGLEIRDSPSHAYVCRSCRHDVFRRMSIHDSGNTALTLRDAGTVGNLIADSDFYANHDTVDHGGSADGLAIKNGSGAGNVVRNCRLHTNSGDGLDLSAFTDPVTIASVWAYGNGVNRWNIADFAGPGNGIKLGGGSPAPAVNTVVSNSAAWNNAGYGFTEASNRGTLVLTNNTAYRNGTGFAFTYSSSTMRHNLALANTTDVTLGGGVEQADNSWNQSGWATTVLRSGDPTTAQATRATDGALPPTTFLLNRKDATVGASMRPTTELE
jgi:RNA polymerase sigma factor (sigma-70 family)